MSNYPHQAVTYAQLVAGLNIRAHSQGLRPESDLFKGELEPMFTSVESEVLRSPHGEVASAIPESVQRVAFESVNAVMGPAVEAHQQYEEIVQAMLLIEPHLFEGAVLNLVELYLVGSFSLAPSLLQHF